MSIVYLASSNHKCKSNSVLSARLVAYFSANGHTLTKDMKQADYIVVNTCGFINNARLFSESLIDDILKRRSSHAQVFSLGCLVKIDKPRLVNRFSDICTIDALEELDALIDATTPISEISQMHFDHTLFDTVNCRYYSYCNDFIVSAICRVGKLFKTHPFSQVLEEETNANKIFIQIGSGCQNHCSYCVIKKARGTVTSRPIAAILEDIKAAYRQGSSMNLVADDCGSYGYEEGVNLFDLLYAIDREYPRAELELSYLHPRWLEQFEDEYVEAFQRLRFRNVNISMQSGSDRVLASMNRGYTVNKVARILTRIKKISPSTMLWGHFIVGHPAETWKDFYRTFQAMRYYDFVYIVMYSPVNADAQGECRHARYAVYLKKIILKLNLYYRLLRSALR